MRPTRCFVFACSFSVCGGDSLDSFRLQYEQQLLPNVNIFNCSILNAEDPARRYLETATLRTRELKMSTFVNRWEVLFRRQWGKPSEVVGSNDVRT